MLWDGRGAINELPAQLVPGDITTFSLGPGTNATVNQDIAKFMTGVYVDQKSDNAAGELDADGATGGPANLLALAQSPTRPCVFQDSGTILTPFVTAVTGGNTVVTSTCTPVTPGGANMTLFQAWENLTPDNEKNAARLSIARGEVVFKRGLTTHCDASARTKPCCARSMDLRQPNVA